MKAPRPGRAGLVQVAVLLFGGSAATAFPQAFGCPEIAPPYKFLRFDEDYGYLRDPRCRLDFWDGVKVVPALTEGDRQVSLGGSVRIRLEEGRNIRYTTSVVEPRSDVVQRYHAHADARFGREVRAFVEIKSNQVAGREPGPIVTDVDRLDVHQAFMDVGPLRIGRQELVYGAARRIFPRNGPNVRGNFDAVRAIGSVGKWSVDGLLFQNVAIDPGYFDDTSQHDQRFWGVYASGPLAGVLRADAYYIGADRDPARFAQGLARELRSTFGVRLFGRQDGWDFDFEPALQAGRFGPGSISAWALQGEIGYRWLQATYRPRVSFRFTAGSGDRDPSNPRLETFNSLFPRGGSTGELFNFSPANLRHVRMGLDWAASPRVAATVGIDGFWRTSLSDAVYGPGGNLQPAAPPPASNRERAVGADLDGVVTWRVTRQLSLSVQAGYFRNGPYTRSLGLGTRQWAVFPYAIFEF